MSTMKQLTKKEQAFKLRRKGKSYNEIRKILNIPSKGTLSYWFKDLHLSPAANQRLEHHILLARERGLLKYNSDRKKAITIENKEARKANEKEIGVLSKRELLLVGVALYWGEGTKRVQANNIGVALANSDARLISLFMRFIREILLVPEERIRAGIQVHENVDIEKAKQFWAEVTRLPRDRFYIVKQISRASNYKRPSNSLPHGTVTIKVNKRILFYKIMGYIDGLMEK